MFKHNYHAHSNLSRHSTHSLEDSIKKAIAHGFETFAISEHGQLEGPYGTKRIITDEEEKHFIDEMAKLKEKYKGQIRVLASFEMEIMHTKTEQDQVEYAANKFHTDGIDFLIIGHHNYRSGKHVFHGPPRDMDEAKDYVAVLEKAVATGKFLYIAHPDGFMAGMNGEMNEVSIWMSEAIADISVKYNIPMGLNLNGVCEKRAYPHLGFWKIAAKKGAKAIYELDSHDDEPFKEAVFNQVEKIAKESGVQIIEKLDI